MCSIRALYVVLLIFLACQDSIQSRPGIVPLDKELIKNEGDSLEILCSGFAKVYFNYPGNKSVGDEVKITSEPEIVERENNGIYKYEFRRRNTVAEDTGWYGCAYHLINSTEEFYFNHDVAGIYVYVQSNKTMFAEPEYFPTIWAFTGEDATIPCRPTSPDYHVQLISNESNIELGDEVSYDPRLGFRLKNVTVHAHGWYTCTAKKGSKEQRVTYYLHVNIQRPLPEPKIVDDTLRHVTVGQTLHVNCTVVISVEMLYMLNWTTPQESDRITVKHYSTGINYDVKRVTSELIITNVTYRDEGEYECSIKSYRDSIKSVKRYISVHDPQYTCINLTSQDSNRYYQSKENDWVQWVVYVDAHPELEYLYWLDKEGRKIDATWKEPERAKYAINMLPTSTVLRINHLDINDMGVYSLAASVNDKTDMLNFTLDVMAKPLNTIVLQTSSAYYAPNQTVDLQCNIVAFPRPNITLTYLKCPNYPSRKNSTEVNLKPFKENENNRNPETGVTTLFSSFARMTVEYTGTVTCTACNMMGCSAVTEVIFVSDGNEGFGIIEPKLPVIQGDDLDLICAASIYNFSSVMEWTDENDNPIVQSDRVKILRNKTEFTFRSILRINNVKQEDAKRYVCLGRNTNGGIEQMDYTLEVKNATAPYFLSTNMNQTERIVDPNTENFKADVILQCFAGGMPRPNVTWYKDGIMLNMNEKYSIHKKGQQLRIIYPRERDSGKYSCQVANRIGKLEAYQQITIKGKELPKGLYFLIASLIIIVIVLVVYFTIKVRREKVMRKELMAAGLMHFEEGALECLNPDLTVDDQAELLPYDKKWEFPRESLKLGKKLGSGAFGVVMKAEAQGICEDEAVTTVAVKMVRRTTDPTYVRALASELKIMVHLGKHLNVVNLLGACTKNISKRELLVIVEYCRFGNLHNYLLRHRADFINQIDSGTGKFDPSIGLDILNRTLSISSNNSLSANSGTESVHYCQGTGTDSQGVSMSPDGCVLSNNSSQPGWRSNYRGDYKDHNLKPICTQDLLSWAFQVARGMEYLSQRRVLHGDLAARNILLAENSIVKICDFGLAKTMYKDDNYKKKGDGPLPIKWMAIESIRDRIFSTQSDIWSFGIVLWEFFTLAETPYPGMEAEKQYQKLIEGYRMEQPEYATSEIYDIMLQCWKAKPTLRPSFTELVESIGDLLEESVRAHYISLNAPYMDMNTMILEGGKKDYLTMMSAPDHVALSSPTHEYVNSPKLENQSDSAYLCMNPASVRDESGIFSPRPLQEETHFDFPLPTSDSEDAVELSPMLKKTEDDDPYLKPINVQERRAEFARQRQTMKNQALDRLSDRDSGYCNTPRNLHLIDLNEKNDLGSEELEKAEDKVDSKNKKKDFGSSIIKTQDNYVNMPKQKSDLRRDMPDGFSNPSYVMMSHRELDQANA